MKLWEVVVRYRLGDWDYDPNRHVDPESLTLTDDVTDTMLIWADTERAASKQAMQWCNDHYRDLVAVKVVQVVESTGAKGELHGQR